MPNLAKSPPYGLLVQVLDSLHDMKTIIKTPITLEHHCLQLPYASLRLQKRQCLEHLIASMESVGQLVPVVVVPTESTQWILIDGYMRVNALRRIGNDVVDAEAWDCDVVTALLTLLTEHQSRTWEVFEEALLLQELHTQHGLSQNSLANKIGRNQSWVSRRLSLLEQLPESMLHAVALGKLSVWSAVRLLAPMARAMPKHAELLLQYLLQQPHSTRELKCFYEHYKQSTHSQRANMVNVPDLFFKAQKMQAQEKETRRMRAGLEGKWYSQLQIARRALAELVAMASRTFPPYQDKQERSELLQAFHEAQIQWNLLLNTMRNYSNDNERHAADHHQSAAKRQQQSNDCATTEGVS